MRNRSSSLFSHPSYRYAELQNDNQQTAYDEHHLAPPYLMKTANEINNDILNITMKIEETFPELSKYIGEMPLKISDTGNGQINIQNLSDYYNSLDALFKNYTTHHGSAK